MSVLIEHQVSNPCKVPHKFDMSRNIYTNASIVGWAKQCYVCGTVIEYRLVGEYPDE